MVECSNCGTENPDNAKFCMNCGEELEKADITCPRCGEKNPNGAKFCLGCGAKLTKDTPNNPTVTPEPGIIRPDQSPKENDAKKNVDNDHATATIKPSNVDDSNNNCPVCKSCKLTLTIHKEALGIVTKKLLICNNCGAEFEEKGQKYKLSKVSDISQPVWKKYHGQTLSETEWIRIEHGGISDSEQRSINEEKRKMEIQQAEIRKKSDINEFLTDVLNGRVNITTKDPSPVLLKNDEKLSIIMHNVSFRESRAVRQTVGGYGGPTFRIAKGVSFRMGSVAARSESHEELRTIDHGSLILTNKRLIFIGSKRTNNINLNKIVAIEPYKDGIGSQRENKQKTEYFVGINKTNLRFNRNNRQTTIPIDGAVLKVAIQGAIARL